MRSCVAMLVLACGCDRVFFLDPIETATDARDGADGAPGDATGDALADAALPVCDEPNSFCESFDGPPPFSDRWDRTVLGNGSTLSQSQANPVSAPAALDVSVPVTGSTAFVEKLVTAPATRLTVDAKLQLAISDASAEMDVLAIEWMNPPLPCTRVAFMIVASGGATGGLYFQETYGGCTGGVVYSFLASANNAYRNVVIELELGAPSSVTVRLDGMTALSKTLQNAVTPSPVLLRVGVSFKGNQTGSWLVRYDDIIADPD